MTFLLQRNTHSVHKFGIKILSKKKIKRYPPFNFPHLPENEVTSLPLKEIEHSFFKEHDFVMITEHAFVNTL
jgi:hypothetical protein